MRIHRELATQQNTAEKPFEVRDTQIKTSVRYWPSAGWQVLHSRGPSRVIDQLPLPFALVGSHPLCSIRVTDRGVPPVAYFACAFEDSIEVWPLCPLAFSQWGVLSSLQTMLVGEHRIRLMHETHPRWAELRSEAPTPEAIDVCFNDPRGGVGAVPCSTVARANLHLELSWGGTTRVRPMSRRVLILGADHPSTLRLRKLGLAVCDHALVAAGDGIWMIRLDLKPSDKNIYSLVTRVLVGEPPQGIKRLQVTVKPGERRSRDSSCDLDNLVMQSPSSGSATANRSDSPSLAVSSRGSGRKPTKAKPDQLSGGVLPEALAAGVTDKLIQIARTNLYRQKVLLLVVTLAITTGLLCWIILQLLWPLISTLTK